MLARGALRPTESLPGPSGGTDPRHPSARCTTGELRCVGATTSDEYQKHIEPDAAFERRLAKVFVKEPSVEVSLIK